MQYLLHNLIKKPSKAVATVFGARAHEEIINNI